MTSAPVRVKPKSQDAAQILGKRLPYSDEAEKAVLGALLLNDEYMHQVQEFLIPTDFYHTAHRAIYQAMLELVRQEKRIDIITLQDELSKSEQLEQIGGIVYLMALQEDIPSVGLISQHAKIIKEKAILRELIHSATQIIGSCYSQDEKEIDAVLDQAEQTILQIANKRAQQSFVQLNIWLKKTFLHLTDIRKSRKGITGVPTGYHKLDQMTSGWQNGDFVVLAARPSMGKTALALSLGMHAAHAGGCVGFFSLEMSAEQLTMRLLSSQSGVPHHDIRNATVDQNSWTSITNVAAQMGSMKMFIDDTAMVNIMDLRAKARKLKIDQGLSLLVIDYLQLLHCTQRHENRHQEVSTISRSLKALAKELEIPVIALSQLSRAVDSRMDKRPMLSDLRESGAIEQDADVIMFLYRDIVYNPDTENPALAELIIGKQRNGPTGTVYLNFMRELTRFDEADYETSGE